MAFTSLTELFNLLILIVAIAYILSGYIKSPKKSLKQLRKRTLFDWEDFKFATIIAVPAILFHELAHKFVAMAFGAAATFKIFGFGIILGLFLRIIMSPILILAPGYVEIAGEVALETTQMGVVAFAGPLVNLLLWLGPTFILKTQRKIKRTTATFLFYTAFLNMWLFIFNMIPFPPLDGSKILHALIAGFA